MLHVARSQSFIRSFACFLCRLLMNRSTCRDALAGADNGQQLNKGNELNKDDAAVAATVEHPVVQADKQRSYSYRSIADKLRLHK